MKQGTKVQGQMPDIKYLRTPRERTVGANGCEFLGSEASAWTTFCFLLVADPQYETGWVIVRKWEEAG